MTAIQQLMLAACCGYVIGDLLGFLLVVAKSAWDEHKEKKHRKDEQAEA